MTQQPNNASTDNCWSLSQCQGKAMPMSLCQLQSSMQIYHFTSLCQQQSSTQYLPSSCPSASNNLPCRSTILCPPASNNLPRNICHFHVPLPATICHTVSTISCPSASNNLPHSIYHFMSLCQQQSSTQYLPFHVPLPATIFHAVSTILCLSASNNLPCSIYRSDTEWTGSKSSSSNTASKFLSPLLAQTSSA